MDNSIKKDLTSNWFKLLQNAICNDILEFEKDDTILFGRESAGVPEKLHKILNNKLKIPMENNKRSLNLASSVAIILAECLKQTKWT